MISEYKSKGISELTLAEMSIAGAYTGNSFVGAIEFMV